MQALSFLLYLLRDAVFCAALFVTARDVLLRPAKRRLVAGGLVLLLLAGNAALAALQPGEDPELLRAGTDALSFCLIVTGALTQLRRPFRALPGVLAAAVLTDLTADTLYSLFAFAGQDSLWFESAVLLLLLALLLAGLLILRRRGTPSLLPGAFRTVPKWVFAALAFFAFTCYYREIGESLGWYRIFYRVAVIAVIACLVRLFYGLFAYAARQQEILTRLADAERYGETLRQGDEELRRFRHDYKNNLIVIHAFLSHGDADAAAKYLESVGAPVFAGGAAISTGNFTADALLNAKRAAAAQKGVELRFRGAVPMAGIKDADLCVVLSNLVDNAVEAVERLAGLSRTGDGGENDPAGTQDPEKVPAEAEGRSLGVSVDAKQVENYLLLTVVNPLPPDADVRGTSKPDKKNHGLGLGNVRKTLGRIGGALSLERENGSFLAVARIPLEQ